jgi:hypothetical protein
MGWTWASFQSLHQTWTSLANLSKDQPEKKGQHSYALKQAAIWNEWKLKAKLSFSETLGSLAKPTG